MMTMCVQAFSLAGGVARQVGPPSTQLEGATEEATAAAGIGHHLVAAVGGTSAEARGTMSAAMRNGLAGGSAPAAAVAMRPIAEEPSPLDGEVLSGETWHQEASGVSDGASGRDEELEAEARRDTGAGAGSPELAVDGPDHRLMGNDAAVSGHAFVAAAPAAGGGGGRSKPAQAATRPRARKRTDPQRARLHSQLLVASPVQEAPLAHPLEALPIITVDPGPATKRRRTTSNRKRRNALQERLEAAAGSSGRQTSAMKQSAVATNEGDAADEVEACKGPSMRRAAGGVAPGVSTETAMEPSRERQPWQVSAKVCADAEDGADSPPKQQPANRPGRRGSTLAARSSAAEGPATHAQDAGAGKGSKRGATAHREVDPTAGSKRRAAVVQDGGLAAGSTWAANAARDGRQQAGSKQAATAAPITDTVAGRKRAAAATRATVANSPGRRRTVAVQDPRLGGSSAKATAAEAAAARGTGSKPARRPCFALRGLHTKVRDETC